MNFLKKFQEFCSYYQKFNKTKDINKDIQKYGESMRFSIVNDSLSYYSTYQLKILKEDYHNVKRKLDFSKTKLLESQKETAEFTIDGNSLINYSQIVLNVYEVHYKISRLRILNDNEKIEKILVFNDDYDRYFWEMREVKNKIDKKLKKIIEKEIYLLNDKYKIILSKINYPNSINPAEKEYLIEIPMDEIELQDGKKIFDDRTEIVKIINELLEYKTDINKYSKLYTTNNI